VLPQTVERVLERLGLSESPSLDFEGLSRVYGAWCRKVPFDNVRKRIALVEGWPGPLPGDDPENFFQAWLRHGTGATCWGGNGALHGLLRAVGFEARRGVCTMLVRPESEPNHGTVVVHLGNDRYLVDASLMYGVPLPLRDGEDSSIEHGAWGVRCRWVDGRCFLRWYPLSVEEMDCRLETWDATREEFAERHEASRARSGFNFQLTVRTVRGSDVVAVVMGDHVVRDAGGAQRTSQLQGEDRIEFLTSFLGISEELAVRLPPDEPKPEGR
jgi:N-hydroxyarylamine O-acetyltransferase